MVGSIASVLKMSKLKKAVMALAVVIVTTATVAYIQRPWAFTIISEGFPDSTWPASGNFSTQGSPTTQVKQADNQLVTTQGFLDQFDESKGSSLIVNSGGQTEFSLYADDSSANTKFNSFSMAKSLVGVVALKTVSDGKIENLETTVGDLWPAAANSAVADITLGELLDMKSGVSFERDPNSPETPEEAKKDNAAEYGPFSNFARLHANGLEDVLDEVKVVQPAKGNFSYQNINTAILAAVIEHVHSKPIDQLVAEMISEPADAGEFHWRQYSTKDDISPYCCLYATTEWWSKVGYFLMRNGNDDYTLMSEEMFDYFIGADFTDKELSDGEYRSQTRYDILDRPNETLQGRFVLFSGRGGQAVYLLPDQDTVVVRFGENYQPLHSTLYEIFKFDSK